jgi:hypothetical protein
MSNEQEEVIDETIVEETQQEEVSDSIPTLEDYENLQKQLKTALAQKEHFKAKATKIKEEPLTTNTQNGLSREEAILFAKGHTEEEVELAKKLAAINNVSLVEATKDEIFQVKTKSRADKEKSDKAQLKPSYSGLTYNEQKVSEMSKDEHKEAYLAEIEKLGI